ncbi:MAG: PAS domain S-box protein [Spirochaetes bacterium]|nr:PAS domain S-box protein [Spirochaetota bacterium]
MTKIHIIENDGARSLTLKSAMEKSGNVFTYSDNGRQAIEYFKSNSPDDLVLMDINLKDESSADLAGQITSSYGLPVIFLTENSGIPIPENIRQVKNYGFIYKNSDEYAVSTMVKKTLELLELQNKSAERSIEIKDFESAECGIIFTDSSGTIHSVNSFVEKLTGYTKYELLKMNLNALGLWNNPAEFGNSDMKFPLKCKDKSVKQITVCTADIDKNHVMIIIRRPQNDNKLNESQLRLFFEMEPDYCYVIDVDGKILNANSSALNILGYSRDELIGQPVITTVFSPECRDKAEKLLNLADKCHTENKELTIISKNGEKRTILLTSTGVSTGNEENNYAVLIQHDITERKLFDEKISNLLNQQELIMREIHHRVKNDMNAIQSLLVLQYNSTRNMETKNALRDANSRISIMRNIYSKLYTHDDFKKISLRDLITELINEIQMSYETTAVIQHKVELSEIYIESKFAFRIGIIINELITNSYKHSFTGRPYGDISTKISRNPDNSINLVVSNNGIPVDDKILSRENFGFGLNLVNTLAVQNGGSFTISNDNGSIRFEIIFISD